MNKLVIVGRPNVGKSALFNRICKKRISIVDEAEGVTRDRIYGKAEAFGFTFEVIDTGGLDQMSQDAFKEEIFEQTQIAIQEADTLVMVVDGRAPPTKQDFFLAKELLKTKKPLTLAVNKIDDPDFLDRIHAFYPLGIQKIVGISATHGFQVADLLEIAWEGFNPEPHEEDEKGIRVSIVGRCNVGKSTLLNAILVEKRSAVSPIAGTTRDSIEVKFHLNEKLYTLIDTAGIRRKKSEKEAVEKFAAIRTQNAIENSDVCLLLLDALEGITEQEKRIAKEIETAGKACVLLLNKWDLVKGFRMEHCLKALQETCPFLAHAPTLLISAKTGRNLEKIFPAVDLAYAAYEKRITTHQLNKFVEKAIQLNHPPMLKGKRLRIYYMTQVDVKPPRFILFVNHVNLMDPSYKKYLVNQFRSQFDFVGVPLAVHLKGKSSKKKRTSYKEEDVDASNESSSISSDLENSLSTL